MLGGVKPTWWALAAVLWVGCPRDPQAPDPGEEALSCETLADCNRGLECGSFPLRACVDRLCEVSPSLILPCARPDAGP